MNDINFAAILQAFVSVSFVARPRSNERQIAVAKRRSEIRSCFKHVACPRTTMLPFPKRIERGICECVTWVTGVRSFVL